MHKTILATALLASLAACNQPPADKKKVDRIGRTETMSIRNTDTIGVSGSAIANKLDSALNTQDQSAGQLDKALEANESPR